MLKNKLVSSTQILALALAVTLFLPSSVIALTIQLNNQGGATFYQDQVLGDDSGEKPEDEKESETEQPETESKSADEKPETESKPETQSKPADEKPEAEKKSLEELKLREIKRNEKRKIEIKSAQERLEIDLKAKKKLSGEFEKVETMESTSVKFKRPKSKLGAEMELEFELHKDGSGEEMKFKSNGVEVKTRSQFNVDPETNEVTLTSPSGQEHELNYLPREALDAMAGQLGTPQSASGSTNTSQSETEIELKENSEGEMVYQATVQERKRFLGLFGWDKPKTVELNDQTGEVIDVSAVVATTTPAQNAWLNWVRDNLSF